MRAAAQGSVCFLIMAAILAACAGADRSDSPTEASAGLDGVIGRYSDVAITGHVLEPRELEMQPDAKAAMLEAPAGAEIGVFADGLVNPRMLAIGDDGTVYATRRSVGDVLMLQDEDGDGRADVITPVANRAGMHGIAIQNRRAFLATTNDVYVAEILADGRFGPLQRIIDDLPDAGQHPNRTLGIGPDGALYISVGSTCNACDESNPENAAILRASPDGQSRMIYASGLRNTIGFAWSPETGALWAMDQGIDWLGDQAQIEELNRIEPGKKYGWPYIYGMGAFNPQDEPPDGMTLEDWRAGSTDPVLGYTAHSSPMQMVFYDGQQFPHYRGDAFVAMRGSWNRKPPSGYEIVRIDFENGEPVAIEPFITGFLQERADGSYGYIGRPTGIAVDRQGAILVADDSTGVIYRVTGAAAISSAAPAVTVPRRVVNTAAQLPPLRPSSPLAIDMVRPAAAAPGTITVSSPTIRPNAMIPVTYTAEGHDASPPLSWSPVPGARSYVILVIDPDAAPEKPFNHWIVYNIPGEVTALPEGLPTDPILQDPKGVMQGVNSRGAIGYYGPKPPVGDAPHRYHFQLFALDRMLPLKPGATRAEVIAAMRDHVIASGGLVGQFQR